MKRTIKAKSNFDYEQLNNLNVLKERILDVVKNYPVTKVTLFGSRANGNNSIDSDVDLLCEFNTPNVSLLRLSGLKVDLEENLGLNVDVIHGPLDKDSMIEIDKEVMIYET